MMCIGAKEGRKKIYGEKKDSPVFLGIVSYIIPNLYVNHNDLFVEANKMVTSNVVMVNICSDR